MSEELNFDDAEPLQEKVRIRGKTYILIEASADAAVKYRNATIRGARMEDGKVIGIDQIADAEPLLVSLCLCETDKEGKIRRDQNDNPVTVPLQRVRALPHRVISRLFDKCMEMCPFLLQKDTRESLEKTLKETKEKLESLSKNGEAKEDPAKNSQEPTTATTG